PRIRTCIAPSPSTRASAAVWIVRVSPSAIGLQSLALFPERLPRSVEGAVDPDHVPLVHAEPLEPAREGRSVRRLHRAEAAVAAAVIARAERAAAGVGHGPEAGRALGHHHADVPRSLALDTNRMVRDGPPALLA